MRTLQAHVEAVQGRLAELSGAGLALECSQWLDQLSQQLRALLPHAVQVKEEAAAVAAACGADLAATAIAGDAPLRAAAKLSGR